jgi:hypothetical protein
METSNMALKRKHLNEENTSKYANFAQLILSALAELKALQGSDVYATRSEIIEAMQILSKQDEAFWKSTFIYEAMRKHIKQLVSAKVLVEVRSKTEGELRWSYKYQLAQPNQGTVTPSQSSQIDQAWVLRRVQDITVNGDTATLERIAQPLKGQKNYDALKQKAGTVARGLYNERKLFRFPVKANTGKGKPAFAYEPPTKTKVATGNTKAKVEPKPKSATPKPVSATKAKPSTQSKEYVATICHSVKNKSLATKCAIVGPLEGQMVRVKIRAAKDSQDMAVLEGFLDDVCAVTFSLDNSTAKVVQDFSKPRLWDSFTSLALPLLEEVIVLREKTALVKEPKVHEEAPVTDAQTTQALWQRLQKLRKDNTTLLTTLVQQEEAKNQELRQMVQG